MRIPRPSGPWEHRQEGAAIRTTVEAKAKGQGRLEQTGSSGFGKCLWGELLAKTEDKEMWAKALSYALENAETGR